MLLAAVLAISGGTTVDLQPVYQLPVDGTQDYQCYLDRADQLYHHDLYSQAAVNYRFAQDLDRRLRPNPVIHFKIGYCCYRMKRPAEAARHFRLAAELEDLREYASYYLAACLAIIPDSQDIARSSLKEFIRRYPRSVLIFDARMVYIRLLLEKEMTVEADRQWLAAQTAVQSNPALRRQYEPLLPLMRGHIRLRQGQHQKAINYYRLVQSNYRYSDEAYEAKQKIESIHRMLDRHLPVEQFVEGLNILILHGRYDEALDEIQAKRWQYASEQQVLIDFQVARIAFSKARYYDASIKFERLWRNNRHKESLYQLSRTARYSLDLALSNQALQDYLVYVVKTPAWAQYVRFEIANNYAAMGDSVSRRQAIELYRQIRQKAPINSLYGYSSAFQEAFNHYKFGELDSAIVLWTRLAADVPSLKNRCTFWIAKSLEKKELQDSARTLYRQLAEWRMRDYYGMLSYTMHLDNHRVSPHRLFYVTGVPLLNESAVYAWQAANETRILDFNGRQLLIPELMIGDTIQRYLRKTWLIRDVLSAQAGERELEVYHNYFYNDFYKTLFVKRLAEDLKCHNIAVSANVVLRSGYAERFNDAPDFQRLMYPAYYLPTISLNQTRYPLDASLVLAVIKSESAFRSSAISPARAVGLMQIMPFTGREIADQLNLDDFRMLDLQNPSMSIRMGMHYLYTQARTFKAYIPAILAAYNAGPHRARFWMSFYNEEDPEEFPESVDLQETGNYIQRIMLDRWVYSQLYNP